MAVTEVVEWVTVDRENLAIHPVGPQGREASRISLTVQELQGAIARWGATLVTEAPIDGMAYARKDGAWEVVVGGTSPLTTKGDLYTYDTGDARLPVGTDGFVLSANSAEATGLEWVMLPGGGNVSAVPTPVDNQLAVWTGALTIEGDPNLTWDGSQLEVGGFMFVQSGAASLFIKDTDDLSATATPTITLRDSADANMGVIGYTAGDGTFKIGNMLAGEDLVLDGGAGLGKVELQKAGAAVAQTISAATGGLQVNNTLTGAGFERVLTASDLVVAGGQVDSVSGGTNINVSGTAVDPIVNLDAAITGTSVNGVTLTTAGVATNYLDETGSYSTPPDTFPAGADGQIQYNDGGTAFGADPFLSVDFTPSSGQSPTLILDGTSGFYRNPTLRLNYDANDFALIDIREEGAVRGEIRYSATGAFTDEFRIENIVSPVNNDTTGVITLATRSGASRQVRLIANRNGLEMQNGSFRIKSRVAADHPDAVTYGQIFHDSGDGDVKWRDSAGAEYSMTSNLGSGVSVSGTPVDNQFAIWTNATTIEGEPALKYDSTLDNLSLGVGAGAGLTTGENNFFIGEGAGANVTTQDNIWAFGPNAGPTTPTSNRMYIGKSGDNPNILINFFNNELTLNCGAAGGTWDCNNGSADLDLIANVNVINTDGDFEIQDSNGATASDSTPKIRGRRQAVQDLWLLGYLTGGNTDFTFRNEQGEVHLTPANTAGVEAVEITQGGLVFNERADHATTPTTGKGEVWMRNGDDALIYTNPAGTDFDLTGGGGAFTLDAQENLFAGTGAGAALLAGANDNFLAGENAGAALDTGDDNIAIGRAAMTAAIDAIDNVVIGAAAAPLDIGNTNTIIGAGAGATTNLNSDRNVLIGAGSSAVGDENVMIGNDAGNNLTSGSGNVWIGYDANPDVAGANSNRLIIDNGPSAAPFIDGNFATGDMTFNSTSGKFLVRNSDVEFEGTVNLNSTDGQLQMRDSNAGTIPAASPHIDFFRATFEQLGSLGFTGSADTDFDVHNNYGRLKLAAGVTSGDQVIELEQGGLLFNERADHAATPSVGKGEVWMRDSDDALIYTNPAGTDFDLTAGGGGGTIGGSIADNQIAVGSGVDTVDGSANLTWNDTTFNVAGVITADDSITVDGATTAVLNLNSTVSNARLSMDGPGPQVRWRQSGAGLDQKIWEIDVASEEMRFQISDDAFGNDYQWMTVTRSGTGGGVTADLITLNAPVTVTGAFTSLGIDDNATSERLQISDFNLNAGSLVAASQYGLAHRIADGTMVISGSNSLLSGGTWRGFGSSHATRPDDFELSAGGDVVLSWDETNGELSIFSSPGTKVLVNKITADGEHLLTPQNAASGMSIVSAASATTEPNLELSGTTDSPALNILHLPLIAGTRDCVSVISNVTTANGFFIQTDAVTTGHAIRATVGGAVAGDAVFIDVANAGASGDALRLENIGSGLGLKVASGGAEFSGNMGFFGTTATTKPNITGSRGGNAALASLLTGLASLGLITDSTTA